MDAEKPLVNRGGVVWNTTTLGAIASIHPGSTPSREVPEFWGGTIPWVTPGELTGLRTKYLPQTRESITRAGLASCAATVVPRDSLLVTTRATLGAAALAAMPIATNQGFRSLVFNASADPHFYYHLTPKLRLELTRRASGTTFLEISGKDFEAIPVPLPPLIEQRRIAEILDTLDEAIRSTEQVIAKLQQVKQGLLHDLLTRGIDENGELRDPERHPEQFQDSPLGRVPLRWEICTVARACSAVVDCPHSTPNYGDSGVLVARTMHIRNGRYDIAGSSRISEREYQERIARLEPQPGDVILTREAPVGEAFRIPDGMRICLGQRVMLLRPDHRRLHGDFLVAQIYSGSVKQRVGQLTGGTTNPHLNVAEVREFPLPLPPLEEQERQVFVLRAADASLNYELAAAVKLRTLKSGLMDDLLTGRVRVTLPAEATP